MIALSECTRQRDGTLWRPSRQSPLKDNTTFLGLGPDETPGFLWIEYGNFALRVQAQDIEPIHPQRTGAPNGGFAENIRLAG